MNHCPPTPLYYDRYNLRFEVMYPLPGEAPNLMEKYTPMGSLRQLWKKQPQQTPVDAPVGDDLRPIILAKRRKTIASICGVIVGVFACCFSTVGTTVRGNR